MSVEDKLKEAQKNFEEDAAKKAEDEKDFEMDPRKEGEAFANKPLSPFAKPTSSEESLALSETQLAQKAQSIKDQIAFEKFERLVEETRSYRRYDATDPISRDELLALLNIARKTPSGRNLQKLKFHVVTLENKEEMDALRFDIHWGGTAGGGGIPESFEAASGYIVICTEAKPGVLQLMDTGIVAQTLMLAARTRGWASCMFKSFSSGLITKLGLNKGNREIVLVVSFGRPAERIALCDMEEGQRTNYWRDETTDTHMVPKRKVEDMLI